MSVETVMWLLPVFFMIHDFEEIIMMEPWAAKYGDRIRKRFPGFGPKLMSEVESRTTASMAFAVAIIFTVLSLLVFIAVWFNLKSLWMGILLAYSIHIIIHFAQAIMVSGYVPVLIGGAVSFIYCLFAFYYMNANYQLDWLEIGLWAAGLIGLLAISAVPIFRLASVFNRWLTGWKKRD
jgi:hypothetical protein